MSAFSFCPAATSALGGDIQLHPLFQLFYMPLLPSAIRATSCEVIPQVFAMCFFSLPPGGAKRELFPEGRGGGGNLNLCFDWFPPQPFKNKNLMMQNELRFCSLFYLWCSAKLHSKRIIMLYKIQVQL